MELSSIYTVDSCNEVPATYIEYTNELSSIYTADRCNEVPATYIETNHGCSIQPQLYRLERSS